MKVSPIVLIAVFGVVCQAATIPQQEQSEPKQNDLFEIDVETAPEDGSIRGLRIRRSGDSSTGDYLGYPDIAIEKQNDGSFSINGIRVKRSDLKDLSDVDLDEEATDEEAGGDRTRRSGGDLLGFLGSKLQQKLSLFASSSSGSNAESDLHYGAPVNSYDTKSFDIWAFKKAILSTLLQAAKAIKGGVIALGGQIIKAKGQLISAKGKIIATKGDSISEVGRNIAANALLSNHASAGPVTAFASAGADHDQHNSGFPSGVSSGYGAPTPGYSTSISTSFGSSSSHGYTKRGAYAVPQEVPKDVHAGLLVLKPINVPDESGKSSSYGKRKGSPFAQARDSDSSASELEPITIPRHAEERTYYVY